MQSQYNKSDIPSYMYEYTKLVNGTIPLWSKPHEHRNYFEVEIRENVTDQPFEKNIDEILNMNQYTCPICNINVPNTYMSEHVNTIKHITCSKITNIALERAKLQLQLNVNTCRKVEVAESYFCESCSEVILNSEGENHKSSEKHRISIKHDDLLQNLVKVYEDIGYVEVETDSDFESVRTDLESTLNVADNLETEHVQSIQISDSKAEPTDTEQPNESNELEGIDEPIGHNTLESRMNNIKFMFEKMEQDAHVLRDNADKLTDNIINIEDSNKEGLESAKMVPKATKRESKKFLIHYRSHFNKNNNVYDINVLKDWVSRIDAIMNQYFDNSRVIVALNDSKENIRKLQEIEQDKEENNVANDTSDIGKLNNIITLQNKEHLAKTENKDYLKTEQNIVNKEVKEKPKPKTNSKTKVEQKKSIPNKEANFENNTVKSNDPSLLLVNYLKDITRKNQNRPTHTLRALTDSIIEITAINGDRFKVPVKNFHSFHVKALNTYCKVCEIPNVGRSQWHITNSDHVGKVMAPILDANAIRQVDDIWSHCIICNDLTKNVEFHLQSLLHKNKFKHCLVELGHQDWDSDKKDPNDENQQADLIDHSMYDLLTENALVITNKGYLSCIICEVIVTYDRRSIEQHIKSFDHLTNFDRTHEENKLFEIGDELYCIPCDIKFVKTQAIPHCNVRRHKTLLQEYLKRNGTVTEDDGDEIVLPSISQHIKKGKEDIDDFELICFVCNIIIYNTDEHMQSFDHKKRYCVYLEANKLNELETGTFFCIPCNTVMTIDYLLSHCMSKKHKVTLNKFTGKGDAFANEENVKTPKEKSNCLEFRKYPSNRSMPLKVLYQYREMTDKTKLLCTVCDEEVFYAKKEAERHVSSLDHVVAFNLMMLWNKIKKRHDRYYCDVCRIDMTYFSEITHVLGEQHAANLAKEAKGTVYEYDKTLVTHAHAMSLKVGNRTRTSSVVSVGKAQTSN